MAEGQWAEQPPSRKDMEKAVRSRNEARASEIRQSAARRLLERARDQLNGLEASDEWTQFIAVVKAEHTVTMHKIGSIQDRLRGREPVSLDELSHFRVELVRLQAVADTFDLVLQIPENFRKACADPPVSGQVD